MDLLPPEIIVLITNYLINKNPWSSRNWIAFSLTSRRYYQILRDPKIVMRWFPNSRHYRISVPIIRDGKFINPSLDICTICYESSPAGFSLDCDRLCDQCDQKFCSYETQYGSSKCQRCLLLNK